MRCSLTLLYKFTFLIALHGEFPFFYILIHDWYWYVTTGWVWQVFHFLYLHLLEKDSDLLVMFELTFISENNFLFMYFLLNPGIFSLRTCLFMPLLFFLFFSIYFIDVEKFLPCIFCILIFCQSKLTKLINNFSKTMTYCLHFDIFIMQKNFSSTEKFITIFGFYGLSFWGWFSKSLIRSIF